MNQPEPSPVPPPAHQDTPQLPRYDDDFVLWLRSQAELLRARRFELLDVDKLSKQIDSIAIGEHRELCHRLEAVLIGLLKLKLQPDNKCIGSLLDERQQIGMLIEDSPSLIREVSECANRVYRFAVSKAASGTGVPESAFPPSNPFSDAEILAPDYFP